MKLHKITLFLLLVMILANCEQKHEPTQINQESGIATSKTEPGMGIYDSFFDKTKWTSTKHSDGRILLKHNIFADCYLGYNTEPLGYAGPEYEGFSISKEGRKFQGSVYNVFTVRKHDTIWCVTYSKQNSLGNHDLTVYAADNSGNCLKDVESIIDSYEYNKQQGK